MIIKWRHDLKILFNSEGRWQPLLNAAQDDYMTVIIQVLTIACSCYFISSNTGILNSPKKLFLRCKPGRNRTGRKLTVDKIRRHRLTQSTTNSCSDNSANSSTSPNTNGVFAVQLHWFLCRCKKHLKKSFFKILFVCFNVLLAQQNQIK